MIIATACAFFVKGICGFANTLVFTTIIGFKMVTHRIVFIIENTFRIVMYIILGILNRDVLIKMTFR